MLRQSQFKPAFWCQHRHLQTLVPRLLSPKHELGLVEERLELNDGDFLDLCWTHKPSGNEAIVIIFHGLEGSIHSPYANGVINSLKNEELCTVFMHFRGCSGTHNRLEQSYHSGKTDDIGFLIQTLKQRHPDSRLFTVGYSLGGNALLKYLGETGNDSQVQAAVAVSVPYLLNRGADALNSGFSKFYQWYLIRSLQKKIQDKFRDKACSVPLENLQNLNAFWLFDHHITAPIHGFQSAEDYYHRCSSRQYLKFIETPTLLIHAKDDPFLPYDAIPEESELSDQIELELSVHGGHVGFVTGLNPAKPEFWLEQRIPEYIKGFI